MKQERRARREAAEKDARERNRSSLAASGEVDELALPLEKRECEDPMEE
jgi:hypothetical protein